MKLSRRLPILVATSATVAALAVGALGYLSAAQELRRAAERELVDVLDARHAALVRYFDSINQDLKIFAANVEVHDALISLAAAYARTDANEDGERPELRRIFTVEEPTGDPDELATAESDGVWTYNSVHGKFYHGLERIKETRGYYDVFLIDRQGNLVFTVVKENDFATNLRTGRWRDTGLAKVVIAAIDEGVKSRLLFSDFEKYLPSNGAPASFIAVPLTKRGRVIGALAFQMPLERLNTITLHSAGLGDTGETYLVGADRLIRTNARLSDKPVVLERRVATEPVARALQGETGIMSSVNTFGHPVLAAYRPLTFRGTTWAMLAEREFGDLLSPVKVMRTVMAMIGGLVAFLIGGIGIVVANGLSRPIVKMTNNMRQLAAGDLGVEIGSTDRTDEIGDMAAALNVFKENAVKRQKAEDELTEKEAELRIALDSMPGGIRLIDKDRKYVFFNSLYVNGGAKLVHPGGAKLVHLM